MDRWKIFILFWLMCPYFGVSLKLKAAKKLSEKRFNEITSYVGDLVSDYNRKHPENINDVAIIQFMKYRDNFFIDKLIEKIPKQNVVLMPEMEKKIKDQHIRTTAFIIILADNFDAVSKM
jgi:hypothetical protein